MPVEQMFATKQLVEAMTRTTCENDCGNCNVCHLSIALAYEKFMRRGDVKHINACLEASLRKVKRVEAERDEALDALGRIGGVLFMHSHADTCAVELSPNAGYECSCWRAGIYAALGVKP